MLIKKLALVSNDAIIFFFFEFERLNIQTNKEEKL